MNDFKTVEELAEFLHKKPYEWFYRFEDRDELKKVSERAKELGFTFVTQYSDDTCILHGWIDDEFGDFNDGVGYFLPNGDRVTEECGCKYEKEAKKNAIQIKAEYDTTAMFWRFWLDHPEKGRMDCPNFEVLDHDGDDTIINCKGIVFREEDLQFLKVKDE